MEIISYFHYQVTQLYLRFDLTAGLKLAFAGDISKAIVSAEQMQNGWYRMPELRFPQS